MSFGPSRLLLFLRPRFGKRNLAGDFIAPVSCNQSCLLFVIPYIFRGSLLELSRSRTADISITALQSVVSSATDVIQVQASDSRAKKEWIFNNFNTNASWQKENSWSLPPPASMNSSLIVLMSQRLMEQPEQESDLPRLATPRRTLNAGRGLTGVRYNASRDL